MADFLSISPLCVAICLHDFHRFFASRVDPLIGGSYMTLLNTAANLGGTYPASLVMWLLGVLSKDPTCTPVSPGSDETICTGGRDPFVALQLGFMVAGILWVVLFRRKKSPSRRCLAEQDLGQRTELSRLYLYPLAFLSLSQMVHGGIGCGHDGTKGNFIRRVQ